MARRPIDFLAARVLSTPCQAKVRLRCIEGPGGGTKPVGGRARSTGRKRPSPKNKTRQARAGRAEETGTKGPLVFLFELRFLVHDVLSSLRIEFHDLQLFRRRLLVLV